MADVTLAHNFPERFKAAAAKFKFNIVGATPATAGSTTVVTFSVTDPTNGDAPYDIKAHPAFTAGANSTLTVKLGWTTSGRIDIGNGGSGENYGQPVSVNALTAAVAGAAAGAYTGTSPVAIPAGQAGRDRLSNIFNNKNQFPFPRKSEIAVKNGMPRDDSDIRTDEETAALVI